MIEVNMEVVIDGVPYAPAAQQRSNIGWRS